MNTRNLIDAGGLLLATGAGFVLGRTLESGPSPGEAGADLEHRVSLGGARSASSSRASDPVAQELAPGSKAAESFLDKYRSSSGRLPPEGMRKAVAEALQEKDLIKANSMVAAILENLTVENAAAAFESMARAGMT